MISDVFEVKDLLVIPNPYNQDNGDMTISVNITMPATTITVSVYTVYFRKVVQERFEGSYLGIRQFAISARKLSKLSSGSYYVVVKGMSLDAKTAVSRIEEMVVLR